MEEQSAIFIAGPTASGKSACALALAQALGGVVINADAMQVYRDLRVVTARPAAAEEARAPHRLYGALSGAERCSAGRWARMAAAEIAACAADGRVPILVGGAGLYFKALEEGLSPIPETPPAVRKRAEERRAAIGAAAFRAEALKRDPAMAHLPEGDSQRLTRAWAVFEATGKPLSEFQSLPREKLTALNPVKALIAPPRETLYARCDARAAAMIETGGLEEVRALLALDLALDLPVMKTLGVREIESFLSGGQSREAALAELQRNTRRFAKRQMTWFRRQAADWPSFVSAKAAQTAILETFRP